MRFVVAKTESKNSAGDGGLYTSRIILAVDVVSAVLSGGNPRYGAAHRRWGIRSFSEEFFCLTVKSFIHHDSGSHFGGGDGVLRVGT